MGEIIAFSLRQHRVSKLDTGQTALIVIFPGVRVIYSDPTEQEELSVKSKRKRPASARRKSKASSLAIEQAVVQELETVDAVQCIARGKPALDCF